MANDDRRTSNAEYEKIVGQRWDYPFFRALGEHFDSELLKGEEDPCRIVLCTKRRPEGQVGLSLQLGRVLK